MAKQEVEEAKKFFKRVQEESTKHISIPDSNLQQKIKRVSEGAGEIVHYIEEKSNPKNG